MPDSLKPVNLESSKEFIRLAVKYATEHSDDAFTKNGAILVTADRKTMIYATNLIPGRVIKTPERCDRPLKYQYLEHAERTAIFRAGANGINTTDSILYCPWYACVDCARAIISAGVAECIGVKKLRDSTPERWLETVRLAESMLIEAGVKCSYIEDEIGECEMFQDGKLV